MRTRSRSRSPEGDGGIDMDVLVDNEPLPKFQGDGEGSCRDETWTYIPTVPTKQYTLRFANMADDARDLVVEIRVDGEIMSRNYKLPRHRSKIKQGRSDGTDTYPWIFQPTHWIPQGHTLDSHQSVAEDGDEEGAGTIVARFYQAREQLDDRSRGGKAMAVPAQVAVAETGRGSKNAKFTTAYGEPERDGGMGGQRFGGGGPRYTLVRENPRAPPLATIKLVYRDISVLNTRGITPSTYQLPHSLQDVVEQSARERQAQMRLDTNAQGFAPGEVIDLT